MENKEIHKLYFSPLITKLTKSRRMRWECSAHGIDEENLEDLSGNLKGRYDFEDGTRTLKRNTVQLGGTM